jgi:hypothetical protein
MRSTNLGDLHFQIGTQNERSASVAAQGAWRVRWKNRRFDASKVHLKILNTHYEYTRDVQAYRQAMWDAL